MFKLQPCKLGSFNQISTKIVCSDPCYEFNETVKGTDKKLTYIAKNVLPGIWKAYNFHEGDVMFIIHKDYKIKQLKFDYVAKCGIDSGQCCMCDLKYYREDRIKDTNKFYKKMCKLTTYYGAKVFNHGCVSSTGGDGVFKCYVAKNKNKQIVGICLDWTDLFCSF